jgi:uncharacterized protein YggE
MSKLWLFPLSACLVLGQATQKSVTITASRSINLQPDQVVFDVTVESSFSAGLDDIVAALRGSGITAANLSSVYTQTYTSGNQPQQSLQWNFVLPVVFGSMQDTVASLTNLQAVIAHQNTGLVLSFGLQGTQVSAQARQAQQCSPAGLIADAQAQAQKLADAAGFILGPVLAISEAGPAMVPAQAVAFGLIQVPNPLAFISPALISQPAPSNCSLTVKFALFGG